MYPKLGVVDFGKQLLASADLDPVYVALLGANLERKQLARWLIAYWLFYSSGFACWVSEQAISKFWDCLLEAARNEKPTPFHGRWPRGAERRHFRGEAAVKAVQLLWSEYGNSPEDMISSILEGPQDVRGIMERVKAHYLFGDWIAFKVADMLDAVWGAAVDQRELSAFLYDTPRKSILENWRGGRFLARASEEGEVLVEGMLWLRDSLAGNFLPHKPKSPPDFFSLETVWCKHLSHVHGHYPLNKDVREISHGLLPWLPFSTTAKLFAKFMPREKVLGDV